MEVRFCEGCGIEIYRTKQARFCSDECRDEFRKIVTGQNGLTGIPYSGPPAKCRPAEVPYEFYKGIK